jgi:hypothetical protein
MGVKFNSGRGAHLCDNCRVMICEGTLDWPKSLRYHYLSCKGPEQHWLLSKANPIPDSLALYKEGYNEENDWEFQAEFCAECATVITIQHDVTLVSAKELFHLEDKDE